MFSKNRIYSLHKSQNILSASYKWYKQKRAQLSPAELTRFESQLQQLDEAILKGDRVEANRLARLLEEFNSDHFKKGFGSYLLEMFVAILIALAVATVVRQSWFELMEIPTGSMRPTFKEQDHLTVTKTVFGINVPLETKHFYFDPNLVQRTSAVIWSGDGVPHLDSDSSFMVIFPYTKRYIKRNMGKPGDTLYFYGGKLYGFDDKGNDLVELRDNPWMVKLDNVPFTNFEGRRATRNARVMNASPEVIFNHFNNAIGKLRLSNQNIQGEVFNGKSWVKDNPEAQRMPHEAIETYSDWYGIRNFAMGRLLNKEQLEKLTSFRAKDLGDALLYLELRHTPSLSYPEPLLSDHVTIKGFTTVIPLQEKHLKALMDSMYTCRFVVKNGKATSYHQGEEKFYPTSPSFPKVPDGRYEFYYGKAYSIGWGGIASELPSDHPLYDSQPRNIQRLFNVGIDMNTQIEPLNRNQLFFPSRYIYFRNGDLYAMGGVLMKKDDPVLNSFNEREVKRESLSNAKAPYAAFKDYGPPLTSNGKLDKKFIETFGYKVPDGHYLMLGDNHAMSRDSRYFGPVPQANLQGAPSLVIWPPGQGWGIPSKLKPYPLITLPRLIVWSIVAVIALIWYLIHRRNLRQPVFKKLP